MPLDDLEHRVRISRLVLVDPNPGSLMLCACMGPAGVKEDTFGEAASMKLKKPAGAKWHRRARLQMG